MSSSYGLQVTEGAGLGEDTYGLLLSINGLMIVFFELPLTSWTRRLSPPRVMAWGYALVGIGMACNLLGANLGVLVISMVIATIGEMLSLPIAQSYMATLAPEEMRGRYMGVMAVAWSSATMIGPAAGVALFEFNPIVLWIVVCGVALLASAAVLCIGATREGERTEGIVPVKEP
jgi:predicted MFS family arabinose efflux permease